MVAQIATGRLVVDADPPQLPRPHPGDHQEPAQARCHDQPAHQRQAGHGNRQQGRRIGGPPVRPLDQFQTRVRGGQVEVGPRYSVTNQLDPVRARDPGEFTGGIWEYLYPPRPSTFPAP